MNAQNDTCLWYWNKYIYYAILTENGALRNLPVSFSNPVPGLRSFYAFVKCSRLIQDNKSKEVDGEETGNEWLEAVSDEDYGKLS